jgi:hypothetical protein
MDTTDDAILGGKLNLLQPKSGHRAGHDAILLAAAAPKSMLALDLGAGVGTAGLAMLARKIAWQVTLVEIDPANFPSFPRRMRIATAFADSPCAWCVGTYRRRAIALQVDAYRSRDHEPAVQRRRDIAASLSELRPAPGRMSRRFNH